MILIPEGNAMRMETHATVQTPGNASSRLDSELSHILHSNSFKNESEKWLAYQDILEKYLQKKKGSSGDTQSRDDVQSQIDEEEKQRQHDFDISVMLQSVKKTYRDQAKQLANFIERSSNIQWTKSGRVVIDNVELPNSNIADLLNDAARYRVTSAVPNGRAELSVALRKAGVPRKLIGNKRFWEDGELSQMNITDGNIVATSSPKDTSKRTSLSSASPPTDNDARNSVFSVGPWLKWRQT